MSAISEVRERDILASLDDRTREIVERRRSGRRVRGRGWLVRRALLVADLVGMTLAFLVAQRLFPSRDVAGDRIHAWFEVVIFFGSLPGFVVVAKVYGLYDKDEERTNHSTTDDFAGVFHLVTVCTWLFYTVLFLTRLATPQLPKLFTFWALAVLGVVLLRASARAYCRRQIEYLQNTVIVGAGDVGQTIARKLLKHPEYGVNLVGFVDGAPRARMSDLNHVAVLGSPDELPTIVALLDIERVIVAFSNDSSSEVLRAIRRLSELNVQVDVVPRYFDILSPGVDIHTVEGLPMLGLRPPRLSSSSRLLKRTADVIVSAIGLALLAPTFAVIALLIKRDSAGPVFFRQVRMGAGGECFRIFKFRTMVLDAESRKSEFAQLNKHLSGDGRMFKIENDPRTTCVGKWLRRYSLDELPQLINVFLGHMALVGPRPLILQEHRHVEDWAIRRLDLRPGITGLWQVLGSDEIGFDEMVKLDYVYVTTWSLFQDFRLACQTIPVILRGQRSG